MKELCLNSYKDNENVRLSVTIWKKYQREIAPANKNTAEVEIMGDEISPVIEERAVRQKVPFKSAKFLRNLCGCSMNSVV